MTTPRAALDDAERLDWLQLIRSDGIGPRTFAGLMTRFGTAAAAIAALPTLAKRRTDIRLAAHDVVRREFDEIARRGLHLVATVEPAYPAALRSIDTAPPLLLVRGRLEALSSTMVAIVGSRNASGAGLVFTERLARALGAAGMVVVSGLARGIDAKAHRAALPTGTIAVLAGGHDRIYPEEHVELAEAIADTGALVSEMPLGWEPRGRDFPRRNRLVSGLSHATVVVEAARRSGSLITAGFANEQGREVFAVPGSPLDPRAEGTNDLLRQGASLCLAAEDVIDSVARMTAAEAPRAGSQGAFWEQPVDDETLDAPTPQGDADPAERIRTLLGPAPIALDDLVRLTGFGAARLRTIVFDLELAGEASLQGGSVIGRDPGRF